MSRVSILCWSEKRADVIARIASRVCHYQRLKRFDASRFNLSPENTLCVGFFLPACSSSFPVVSPRKPHCKHRYQNERFGFPLATTM